MTTPLERLLIADWNVYMGATLFVHQMREQGKFVALRKPSEANLAFMREVVAWCREQHVEPRLWLFFLFQRTNWRFPPQWKATHLMSPAALEKFRKTSKRRNTAFFRRRLGASAVAENGVVYDPNRDVTPSIEGLKARLHASGQGARCLDEVLVRTLGYHPLSAVCQACPWQIECAIRLEGVAPFPILALRAGRITAAQAEEIANGIA